ncbi:MAG: dipeptidase [Pseudotabrizicola sp.]|uniref:dipeptidase n=1 Tax=Pseudotabrizicola sp. TaxID=2939647 RepID=UPI0027159F1B|nr:dipeptidase [Pseudotabrizicola sp.]MDO9641071.1 dipeptidase [Pseudotabrizicola sp.]
MNWTDYLDTHQSRFVDELVDFVRIPSVSADDAHKGDVVRAGEWVMNRLRAAGAENIVMMPTAGHPVVYADWLHAGADKPTILIYGHFDVQPAEPFDLWDSPPFDATVRDDKVFGRGASDDKGGMFIPIIAAEAMLKTTGRLPVNVKFFFEGQEEIGSPHLPPFVTEHGAMLKADMIFSADGSQWAEDQPQLITGLKGLVACEVTVTGARSDQHSGQQGGGIANPIQGLSQIIASMKGPDGRITVDGFYDDVIDLTVEDRAAFARIPFDEAAYIDALGVPDVFGEPNYTTRERLWARPTFELNGIWGGWQGNGIKTVLPAEARAKITCRLVANQKPDTIYALLKSHIETHIPHGLRARVDRLAGSADPFLVPSGHNSSTIAGEVLTEVYGKSPYITRTGGSIPVMTMLLNELGVHATVFAFGLPDENLHAPNEFFRLSSFRIGQTAYCRLLERLGE